MQRLSVVIAYHDCQPFVGAAVRSALALDRDDFEVGVLDDDSVEVPRGFANRILLHLQAKASQRESVNVGVALFTGHVVVFLDFGDVLPRDLPRHPHACMGAVVGRVRLQAPRIDDQGVGMECAFPGYQPVPSPKTVRRWVFKTTAYPTWPGSANVYARWFLDEVMPVADTGDQAADFALLEATPLLGDVVTIPDIFVVYRPRGGNNSRLLADPAQFAWKVRCAGFQWQFVRLAAGLPPGERALRRYRELLQLHAAAIELSPKSGPAEVRAARLLVDAVSSRLHSGLDPMRHRVTILLWAITMLVASVAATRRLIELRDGRAR